MSWSASQYEKFEDERNRPVRDLIAAIPPTEVKRAIDLGCGPGNSTEVLTERYPAAKVSGIDLAEDMVRAARERLPSVSFELADVSTWHDPESFDLVLSNAVLHWVPGHATLLPRWIQRLSPGGSLAIQMPDNLAEPSHVIMGLVASNGPWASRLARTREQLGAWVEPPAWYYALLRPLCGRVEVWRTTYYHPLTGIDAVVEWFMGSGLRPFLSPLDPEDRPAFLEQYRTALAAAYPAQPDGSVLLPFPRLFFVATR